MKYNSIALWFVLLALIIFSTASCSRGWLRGKIQERFLKKMEEKPAPIASTDITQKIESPGDYTFTFPFGGIPRYYKVHVPKSYSPNKETPLLFVLHGGGGDMEIQSNEEYYHQISKSEENGHIIVFPNGYSKYKSGKIATWNAGNCCAEARDKKVDDVGFIKEVLNLTTKQLHIDKSKVYSTGMSNGAMMTYRLACEMTDNLSAIATVAGTDNTISCNPSKPISVLHIHAKDDDKVLFYGGAGDSFKDRSLVTDFISVPKSISKWVNYNQCNPKPKRVFEEPGVTCDEYSECKEGVKVKLCITEKGGHSWPGGKKPSLFFGSASPSNAIKANDVMWEFFKEN
ncbi:alpha/beta hydrolase-fold protein [Leptospira sp. 85282-16]|uniref:Poly(3-hydroxybutyrate) depolymerase n=1 Tax=Leptospira montravelensis TaxID=2484961 RepID=A0ABY2LNN5_9LEPT|nr:MULTISPECIES: alpha/beta hydrolase-fold protein [Leptospira]MCT8334845.1 alpha/beta hydrolase-fold protein [Leptospira sp. 85282-16]TGK81160.1 poly(3-hydroxybutyrate) depolymerase [Leptospira montravelensis]TGL01240.1 poly(3-hydroxybutyrate) depolymerase [Leptospira montravelensis]